MPLSLFLSNHLRSRLLNQATAEPLPPPLGTESGFARPPGSPTKTFASDRVGEGESASRESSLERGPDGVVRPAMPHHAIQVPGTQTATSPPPPAHPDCYGRPSLGVLSDTIITYHAANRGPAALALAPPPRDDEKVTSLQFLRSSRPSKTAGPASRRTHEGRSASPPAR